jgi:hypothetical protein
MKSNFIVKVVLWGLLASLLCFKIGFGKDLKYIRETVIETKPWTSPYYFPLKLNDYFYAFTNNPIGESPYPHESNGIPHRRVAPSVDYFWALNTGKLVFLNRSKKIVFVLDPKSEKWKEYYPCESTDNYISNLWVGPRDEIYMNVNLKDTNNDRFHFYIELRNYSFKKSGWDNKATFSPIRLPEYPPDIIISPTGNLFISEMNYLAMGQCSKSDIYNQYGSKIGQTSAQDNTRDGIMFNFQKTIPSEKNAFSLMNFDKNGLLAERIREATGGRYHFKATFDNLIIVYGHRNKSLTPIGMPAMSIDLPFIIVFDPVSEEIMEVDLLKDIYTAYTYFSVSDISINYIGEIFAIFVYFNDPGVITGNEKIVLYRWKRG